LAWYDGEALPGQDPGDDAYLGDQEFDRIVEDLTPNNGSRLWESPTDGEVLIAVQSVQFENDERIGALIVVQELSERDALLNETMRTYAIVAFRSLLLVLVIAWWQSGRLLSPLRTLRATADRIGATDLSQRLPVKGNDDITALTHTVNGMLDRLEAAFVSQKQFLDDAGHDLRTPLTVLSGHLELLDSARTDEVEATRQLLLDEVDRMARLTRDLILLAKTDRPDFLRIEGVDLSELIEDLVAKARGLGDRDWRHDGAPAVRVDMDQQRITQAVLQLADNAVKHTQEATRSPSAPASPAATSGSGSAIPAPESRPPTATTSSSGSDGAWSRRTTKASGSGCRSCEPSSPGRAARHESRTLRPGVRSSCSPFPCVRPTKRR